MAEYGVVLAVITLGVIVAIGALATAITGKLGESWEILANAYKPYPCGVVLFPVIDACLELRRHVPAA